LYGSVPSKNEEVGISFGEEPQPPVVSTTAAAVTAATTQTAGRVLLIVARLLNGHHLLVTASATRALPPTLPACFSMLARPLRSLCLALSVSAI